MNTDIVFVFFSFHIAFVWVFILTIFLGVFGHIFICFRFFKFLDYILLHRFLRSLLIFQWSKHPHMTKSRSIQTLKNFHPLIVPQLGNTSTHKFIQPMIAESRHWITSTRLELWSVATFVFAHIRTDRTFCLPTNTAFVGKDIIKVTGEASITQSLQLLIYLCRPGLDSRQERNVRFGFNLMQPLIALRQPKRKFLGLITVRVLDDIVL